MSEITSEIIDCQQASLYLGVSVKTIRRWAQDGKLHGKKVGTRGDWRFTHQDLDKMVDTGSNKYEAIAQFLRENAQDIVAVASERHRIHIGKENPRWKDIKKNHPLHMAVVELMADHLDNVTKGRTEFERLSTEIAETSLGRGLTIEETVDGAMFLKQAIWNNLETTDLLNKLSTADMHMLSRTISTYNDIIASQVAFAYHHHYAKGQEALRLREERYRSLFNSIDDGFCIVEMLYDKKGRAYDYRFVEVNKAFEKIAQMKDPVGKTLFELVPSALAKKWTEAPKTWITTFDMVLKTGKSNRTVDYSESRKRWYDVRSTRVGGPGSRLVAQLFEDVSDKRQAQDRQLKYLQLSIERDELIKVSKAKDEFVGIASHQLRTPATAVKQYIGILQSGMAGSLTDDQQKFLTTAYNSNERQLKLIDDLLKTAQIDAAAVKLNRGPHDINQLVKISARALRPAFRQRQQKFVLHETGKKAVANVDPTEMDLVFTNLIENASKYSHEESQVSVNVRQTKHAIEVEVSDEGVGIAPDDQTKIFDKFTRVSNSLSDIVSGTGLGLYWVKQIVEMHGGTVTVISEPGQGSTFTVRLPLS